MFQHAYQSYLDHAYPYDELRPLSCGGVDTWGSYSLTLVDALDTLAVMGNYSEFTRCKLIPTALVGRCCAVLMPSRYGFVQVPVPVFRIRIRIQVLKKQLTPFALKLRYWSCSNQPFFQQFRNCKRMHLKL